MRSTYSLYTWGIRAFVAALIFAGVSLHEAAAQTTTITTREGKEFKGKVVTEGADAITLIGADSVEIKVPRSQIRSIVYNDSSTTTAVSTGSTAAAAPAVPEKTSFPILGAALGTPAGLNGIVGYYFDGWGVRASAMYLPTINGIEVEFLRNIGRSGTFSHNVHVGAGVSHMEIPGDLYTLEEIYDWRYFTAGYDINWNSFHVSAGLSWGSGSYSNPQLMFQLGYVKEFR
jgi:hypothetical protein